MEFIGSDNLSIDSRRFCNRFTEGVERALVRDRALVVGLAEGPPSPHCHDGFLICVHLRSLLGLCLRPVQTVPYFLRAVE